ncbi:MAG: LuxR C-terminal-related transcriptional regulator [Cyanobacteria bacterium P01_D01_bin.115]
MLCPLQSLFQAIHQAPDEQALQSQVVPAIGEHFEAKRRGIFFFNSLEEMLHKQLPLADATLQKTLRRGFSVEHNPVVRYLVERHAPVHEALVTSPKVWTMVCPRPDHWHVMVGPIVSQGQLIGVVGCTREQLTPAFDTQDLADLSAVCLHLSAWAATARSRLVTADMACLEDQGKGATPSCQSDALRSSKAECLTPRELQIADLVALGKTNAAIGTELWITENSVKQALKRMFRKLEVSSRAEMVAQLAAQNILGSV